MIEFPRITIVTPSFNQGRYIAETIESVLAQDYPNLEHIVMDGGSTDNTLEILKKYTHLKVVSEKDKGQADAINKGFKIATGDIYGFLNSDDTLLPGTLHRVARELNPMQGKHMVMGRCYFIDQYGNSTGIQHPSKFESNRRILEIWRGYMLPQPAIFWSREVWEKAGGMDLSLKFHLDYDLFCKMTQHYNIRCVDHMFATYRLHAESKTEQWGAAERLEDSIKISKRYWGSPIFPTYWYLALSLAMDRFNRVRRAREMYYTAKEHWRHDEVPATIYYLLGAALLAPEVAFFMGVYPFVKQKSQGIAHRFLTMLIQRRKLSEKTLVYMDKTDIWTDGWVGAQLLISRETTNDIRRILIVGEVDLTFIPQPLSLTLTIDGVEFNCYRLHKSGRFTAEFELSACLNAGVHTFEIRADKWFVHHHFAHTGDYRPLAWRIASQDSFLLLGNGKQIILSDHKNQAPELNSLKFGKGWYDLELSGLDWVRWSSGDAVLRCVCDVEKTITMRVDLYTLQPENQLSILINGKSAYSCGLPSIGFKPIQSANLQLRQGENIITLKSLKAGISIPGDTRKLAVAVRNLYFEVVS